MLAILAYVCACEFDKDCEIAHARKVLLMIQQLYVMRSQINQRIQKATLMTKQIIGLFLLTIACLLFLSLLIIVVKYYKKRILTVPCLLLYYYIMLQYDKKYISEDIDINKTNDPDECEFCHCWYFIKINFTYQPLVC